MRCKDFKNENNASEVGRNENARWRFDLDGGKGKIDTYALFSFVVGASATVNFGKFGLVGDIRYNIGVNSLKVDGLKVVTPRALQFSAGLQYML